jgi:hypothetical protein
VTTTKKVMPYWTSQVSETVLPMESATCLMLVSSGQCTFSSLCGSFSSVSELVMAADRGHYMIVTVEAV